ncbi:MAG: diguanylate cyclase [Geobacteraceae bacterium GWC2_58_44]|nr:MAG: diguanylate cyclase [Geobacteraceae bacterium GWC2_58_44]
MPEHGSVVVADEQNLLSRAEDADQRKLAADLRQGTAEQRQEAATLRQGSAGQREVTADQREEIADLRQDTADQREEIADLREDTADLRQDTADLRQDTADLRQDTADLRQATADIRQVTADIRQEAADQREETAIANAALNESTNAQVREANERLIVASIHAQTMTEAAELATEQMSYMAEHDVLTGLPNRALLTDRLAQSIALAQRHEKKVALMYLDLDHFKHVNDSLGHAVGDQLLQSVAKRLQRCVRLSDTVSRQGGDEFVVLLTEIDEVQDAVLTAEKVIEAMARPHVVTGNQLHVTISIGISIYPDDGRDVETMLRNADTAMYQAKKTGRNHFHLYHPEMNARAVARQSVEQALHRALEERSFVLHYQPKVNLDTGAITGCEALIRMQGSDSQLVYPEQFIAVAEECGLILPIGRWALHEACRQAQAWLQSGLDIGQIAVNVSSKEFHCKDFLKSVFAILDDTGLDPRRLELEMTESGLMQDTEPTTVLLSALKNLGVQIAIDDFGTGYSSLSYLLRFPIDTLKIDQSFVQDLDNDTGGSGEAIVSAVIGMGTSLKQRVVAEGIETRQQLAFLQSHHCAEGQGYYFSRPVPAAEFAALLNKPALYPLHM